VPSMSLKWRFIIAPLLGMALMLLLISDYYQQVNKLGLDLEGIVDHDIHAAQLFTRIANQSAVNHASIFNLLRYAEQEADEGRVYDRGKKLLLKIHELESLVLGKEVNALLLGQVYVEPDAFIKKFKSYKYGAANSIILATVDLKLAKNKMLEMTGIFNQLNVDLLLLVKSTEDTISSSLKQHRAKSQTITRQFFFAIISALLAIMGVSILLSALLSKKLHQSVSELHLLTVEKEQSLSQISHHKNEIDLLDDVIAQVKINHNTLLLSQDALKHYQKDLESIIQDRTQALQQSNQQLEDYSQELRNSKVRAEQRTRQIAQKNVEIENAFGQLQKAQTVLVEFEKNAALGRLVAGVAHEVNTPIGITVTAASYLEELNVKMQATLDNKQLTLSEMKQYLTSTNEAIQIILTNTQRSATIIGNFKQIAVDQTSFDYHEINLKDYFDRIIQSLSPEFKRRPITVNNLCDDKINLFTLPGALAQVLTNLLMNSLIHGFETEQVGIINIRARQQDDRVFITYQDNGKGVSADNLVKMYEPFYTTKRHDGGTGLGMHIVYNLVTNALQGHLHSSSLPGEGILFELDLPVRFDAESSPTLSGQ